MARCVCCDLPLDRWGSCPMCDAVMISPPHVCLRWLITIGDEHGCDASFPGLSPDHETAVRLDR